MMSAASPRSSYTKFEEEAAANLTNIRNALSGTRPQLQIVVNDDSINEPSGLALSAARVASTLSTHGTLTIDTQTPNSQASGGFSDTEVSMCSTPTSPSSSCSRSKLSSSRWSFEQDGLLRRLVGTYGAKSWHLVAEELGGTHTAVQCMCRWKNVLSPDVKKGPWTPEEDAIVRELVDRATIEKVKWREIASHLPGRLGKQCRERWYNQLDPSINTGPWSTEEDLTLLEAQHSFGNKWNRIAKLLSGRTENAVKNRFNSATFKRWRESMSVTKTENKSFWPPMIESPRKRSRVKSEQDRSFRSVKEEDSLSDLSSETLSSAPLKELENHLVEVRQRLEVLRQREKDILGAISEHHTESDSSRSM